MPKDSGNTSKSRASARSAGPARNSAPARTTEPVRGKVSAGKTTASAIATTGKDLQVFEKAVALFNSGEFGKAKELFETLKGSTNTGLAHAAESRALMCGRRLAAEVS